MDQFKNVPFGNSAFQIVNFTSGQETPERRYRHCLLQLSQKEMALKECEFRRKRHEIDIDELKEKIQNSKGYGRRRFKVDLDEKEYALNAEIKLIEDVFIEIAAYEEILKELPKFTREEFEEAEQTYWEKRLLGDARREVIANGSVSVGTISSLENIGIRMGRNEEGKITYTNGRLLCQEKH